MRAPRTRSTAALISAAVAVPVLFTAIPQAGAADRGHENTAQSARKTAQAKQAKQAEKLAKKLVKKSTANSAYRHLEKFQEIADDNGGNRAAGTPGHEASARYVHDQLKKAGFKVSYQNFTFPESSTQREKLMLRTPGPGERAIKAFEFSKSTPQGGLTAKLAAARVDETPGCTLDDYETGTFTGKIALVKRGSCTYAEKEAAAAQAGAAGILVYNHSGDKPAAGSVGDPSQAHIPAAGLSKADGEALAKDIAKGEVEVNLDVATTTVHRKTRNVIAETRGGRADQVVALGAHLDSVPEGPGINDNGTGSAGLIEVAQKLAKATDGGKKVTHKVRFAWWSAEEIGLLGSEHYVKQLSAEQQKDIKLYLNFDMIASPNPAWLTYDGDDSDREGAGPGPAGSAQIEKLIERYLGKQGIQTEGYDFDGRSDYGPFIAVGIPAGGTYTGAEEIKTPEQAAKWGGTAGAAFDPNYHGPGDTLKNIDRRAFDLNIDVIAHAVGTYAHDLSSLTS